jgi:hypothetical protein
VGVILPDRVDQLGPRADALDSKRMERLTEVPAVIASLGDDVDLLPEVLADFTGPEPAGLPV